MKKFLLAIFGLVFALNCANGADLAYKSRAPIVSPAPVSWTGFYLGINGGGGFSTQDQSIAGTDALTNAIVASGFVPSSVATRGYGGLFGATAGFNYQLNPAIVIGVETDFDWANIGGSGAQSLALGPFALNTNGSDKLNWIGTFRARTGWLATQSTLLYVTGGLAYGSVDSATSITLVTPKTTYSAAADSTSTKIGWVAGAGVEQRLSQNWSVKAEYDYIDLGSVGNSLGTTVAATPVNFTSSQALRYQTAKIGLNYRF